MRFAMYVASVALLSAQATQPNVSIPAPELQTADELRKLEKQLMALLSDPGALADDNFQKALAWSNLGVICQDLGNSTRAEQAYLRARAILEAGTGNPGEQ